MVDIATQGKVSAADLRELKALQDAISALRAQDTGPAADAADQLRPPLHWRIGGTMAEANYPSAPNAIALTDLASGTIGRQPPFVPPEDDDTWCLH